MEKDNSDKPIFRQASSQFISFAQTFRTLQENQTIAPAARTEFYFGGPPRFSSEQAFLTTPTQANQPEEPAAASHPMLDSLLEPTTAPSLTDVKALEATTQAADSTSMKPVAPNSGKRKMARENKGKRRRIIPSSDRCLRSMKNKSKLRKM